MNGTAIEFEENHHMVLEDGLRSPLIGRGVFFDAVSLRHYRDLQIALDNKDLGISSRLAPSIKDSLRSIIREGLQELEKGMLPYQQEHLQTAARLFTEAITLDDQCDAAYNNRGFAYNHSGRFDEAVTDFTKAIDLSPERPEHYAGRGFAYNFLGRFDEAVTDLTRAIDIDPRKYSSSYDNLGQALIGLGRYDEAVAQITRAIGMGTGNEIAEYSKRGNAYRLMGDSKSAKDDYERAIALFEKKAEKEIDDYRFAIRAERGLLKLEVIKEGAIEQKVLDECILTQQQLTQFYQFEN